MTPRAVPGLLGAALALAAAAGPAAAGSDSLIARVAALRPDVVTPAVAAGVAAECAGVAVCAARALASRLGDGARVETIPPPDTDVIRLVETAPSVTMERRRPDGTLLIRLDRFGRRSIAELLAAVGDEPVGPVLLDLTRNRGGRLVRALEVAALFTGPVPDAVLLETRDGVSSFGIAAPRRGLAPDGLTVRIGPGTASSAEVLALLLRRHADARIVGARSAGKDVAQHALPVDAGTRLLVPIGRIVVAGERLAGGIGPTPGGRPEPAR